ncbi:MAG TPA: glycoside hydrolase family 2 TIM barrel-domain containing protein [Opitutaceae bacterium]|nr:glycoside hydrolase family 2 TIM barrel-domain containing protein [Opitutaceae bacterium]
MLYPLVRRSARAILVSAVLLVVMVSRAFANDPPRIRENFDSDWRFLKGDPAGAALPSFSDAAWRRLNVPHDWSIEGPYDEQAPSGGPGGYLPTGIGWYRKTFAVREAMRGRIIRIEFDGVYMNSDVWINGHHLGSHPYGYTGFGYELTSHLRYGGEPNVIAVRVDNSAQPASRWYSGSGIYRHVWLTATGRVHLARWDPQITTPEVSAAEAAVRVVSNVVDATDSFATITVRNEVIDPDGRVVGVGEDVAPAGAAQVIRIASPHLWSPRSPALYTLRTTVRRGAQVTDEVETRFGIRSVVFDASRGLLLNGEPIKLLGVCLHHDAGAVGAAVPEAVLERRLRLLQAMGCNAIRCSHNPMAPEFYDLCDRLGFLVLDEAFDEWTIMKPQIQAGYSKYFPSWAQADLTEMIQRDRNHPCVVLWSVGNEIGEQRAPNGAEILRPLVETCHREDPTRPVTAAMDNVFTDRGPAPAAFTDLLDVVGYNYVDRWLDRRERYFEPDRIEYPTRRFVGTEDVGLGGIRGVYPFRAMSAGTPERAMYASGPIRVEQLWKFALTHPYDTGHFMWTGIDYLGEARWPYKGSFSGALDTCGFPKDSYYLFQSIFTNQPVLHLLPHWNWPGREGQIIPVLAYTNCDVVELTLNGRSLGAKAREFPRAGTKGGWNSYEKPPVFPTTADLHLSWDVPYAPGVLKAVGWKDGRKVAETEVRTAGPAAALAVAVDREHLQADGDDVAHVTVKVVDSAGTVVPGAGQLLTFAVSGPGVLLGVDNGDPASHESYQGPQRHAFDGRCLGLVQTTQTPGDLQVTVTAAGLRSATATVHALPANLPAPLMITMPAAR